MSLLDSTFTGIIMKIKTIDREQLTRLSRELYDRALTASGKPDCVAGIASGGAFVARAMGVRPVFEVACRRPSSGRKNRSWTRRLIGGLPRWMTDRLRMAEHRWLMRRGTATERSVAIQPEMLEFLANHQEAKVLLVDDAVDSGVTMRCVAEALRKAAPKISILTAAITVTTEWPAMMPDVAIYRDWMLCRFPWSADYKGEDRL
ncbi:MAG: phosphoribosyltransferase [Duncaniella sp.]|nr:phosphoribosyltransferase [Duncaniella sp.]